MEPKKTLSVPNLDKGTYSLHGVSHSSLNIAKDMPGFRGSNDFIRKKMQLKYFTGI